MYPADLTSIGRDEVSLASVRLFAGLAFGSVLFDFERLRDDVAESSYDDDAKGLAVSLSSFDFVLDESF